MFFCFFFCFLAGWSLIVAFEAHDLRTALLKPALGDEIHGQMHVQWEYVTFLNNDVNVIFMVFVYQNAALSLSAIFCHEIPHPCLGTKFVLVAKEVVFVLITKYGIMVHVVVSRRREEQSDTALTRPGGRLTVRRE